MVSNSNTSVASVTWGETAMFAGLMDEAPPAGATSDEKGIDGPFEEDQVKPEVGFFHKSPR